MGKSKGVEMPEDWLRRVDFTFGGKTGLETPEGFGDLTVDDELTVLVKGKVRSLRQDKESSGFCLTVSQIKMETSKKGSLGTVLDKIVENRKKS